MRNKKLNNIKQSRVNVNLRVIDQLNESVGGSGLKLKQKVWSSFASRRMNIDLNELIPDFANKAGRLKQAL